MKLVAALVLSAAFSSALAGEPTSPAVQPPVAEATPAVAATPAAAPIPASADKVEAPKLAIADAQIKQMRERGYKPVLRKGEMVFCRSEGQIGTRFPSTRCSTLDELNRAEQTGKEYVNSIQQQASPTPFKGP